MSIGRIFHLGENTKLALSTLREHKTRSLLTVLGVVIAVVVLIMVFSVMYGVDADMRAYLEDFGTNTLFIFKFEPGFHIGRLSQEERTRKPLTYEDAMAIKEECPDGGCLLFYPDNSDRFRKTVRHGHTPRSLPVLLRPLNTDLSGSSRRSLCCHARRCLSLLPVHLPSSSQPHYRRWKFPRTR